MLKKISIKNFISYKSFVLDSPSMLNVIIGENDTGKTALLKLLYGALKSLEELALKNGVSYKKILSDKLIGTFQPRKGNLGELVSKSQAEKLTVEATMGGEKAQNLYFSFGSSTTNSILDCSEHIEPINGFNTIFIPAKEVLTAFDAIAATRENLFMDGFDDTYLDLIRSLRLKQQRGNIAKELTDINKTMEELFDGVLSHGNKDLPFVFKKQKNEFSMSLTAEGVKKIGILSTLIRNRQLHRGTVLFMDEPETALHPKAIRKLALMLVALSRNGIQVFVTSHSYFLIKQLSIIASRDKVEIMCYSLIRKDGKIEKTESNLKDGLPTNPIIDEALAMFVEEVQNEVIR